MAERKAISKKVRFEVFKRDSFKCQYCGKCAPEVVLEIDHIHPVSKGGKNDIMNYLTACRDCNSGKSNRTLADDSVMAKQRAQLEELNERREQLEQMLKWREGLRTLDDVALKAASEAWNAMVPGFFLNERGEAELRKLIVKHGLNIVLDCIPICERYLERDADGKLTAESVMTALNKLSGVIGIRTQPDWKRDLHYIRGIARNRFNYINERECIRLLEEAYQSGVDIESLRNATLNTRNWTDWHHEVSGMVWK